MAKKKDKVAPQKVYIVRWVIADSGDFEDIPLPEDQYFALFTTETEALAEAKKIERYKLVRFGCDGNFFSRGVEGVSTMPEPVFLDWLEDVGIELPPDSKHSSWQKWWEMMRGSDRPINRDQFLHLLEAMNLVQFNVMEVVPIDSPKLPAKLPRAAYLLVLQKWQDNGHGDFYGANYPKKLLLNKQRAQKLCDRWNLNNHEKPPDAPEDLSVFQDDDGGPLDTYHEDDWWWGGLYEYFVVKLPIDPVDMEWAESESESESE